MKIISDTSGTRHISADFSTRSIREFFPGQCSVWGYFLKFLGLLFKVFFLPKTNYFKVSMVWCGMVWYGKRFFVLFAFFYLYNVFMEKYDNDNIIPTYIFTVTLPREKYLYDLHNTSNISEDGLDNAVARRRKHTYTQNISVKVFDHYVTV